MGIKMVKMAGLIALVLAVGLGAGCRKNKAGQGADNVTNVNRAGGSSMEGVDGIPLGERPEGDAYRGQFEPVYFAYDSSQVQASERFKLETVAGYLKQNPGTSMIIEGHTDERGSREYNLALGERRALAARAYMIGLGIAADRLQTSSFGEEQPVDLGASEMAHSLNRRSEFVIVR